MRRMIAMVLVTGFGFFGLALGTAPAASADPFLEAEPCEYPYEGVYGQVGGVEYQVCQNIIN